MVDKELIEAIRVVVSKEVNDKIEEQKEYTEEKLNLLTNKIEEQKEYAEEKFNLLTNKIEEQKEYTEEKFNLLTNKIEEQKEYTEEKLNLLTNKTEGQKEYTDEKFNLLMQEIRAIHQELGAIKQECKSMKQDIKQANKRSNKIEEKQDRYFDYLKNEIRNANNRTDKKFKDLIIRQDNHFKFVRTEQEKMKKDMKNGFEQLNMSIQAVHALSQMNHIQIQEYEISKRKGQLINLK